MRPTGPSLLITYLLCTCVSALAFAQSRVPDYYGDVNVSATGNTLFTALADKVSSTETGVPSYTPGVWNALKQTDLDPAGNGTRVVLVYGYSDTDGVANTDRTRSKEGNGGGTTDWNREHVFPKSLGSPNLGTSGPGADVHHLRASDVTRNSSRGSRKFADGSGTSKITPQGHWYPGDEFKGDVARMLLYMYLRYGDRCLPRSVAVGTPNDSDGNMIDLLLEWNAEDPVSALEDQRNPIVEAIQGNRNPFIDNPAFATAIWGGIPAEDRFGGGVSPVTNTELTITLDRYPAETSWTLKNSSGQTVNAGGNYDEASATITVATALPAGCYTLTFNDTYGDGMCCQYGSGSFTLRSTAGSTVLASGGSFGRFVTRDFCVGGTGRLAAPQEAVGPTKLKATEAELSFYPNPAYDWVHVRAPEGTTYRIAAQTGQLLREGPVRAVVDLSGLPRGTYLFSLISGARVETSVLVRR